MASIIKVGDKWRAQIRRKGHAAITRTFTKKTLAEKWAHQVEADLEAGEFSDGRRLNDITVRKLIEQYEEEIGKHRPIGKSKAGSLDMLKRHLGTTSLAQLNEAAIIDYAKRRNAMGAGGVTVAMEFTYLDGVLEMARSLWKTPLRESPVKAARKNLRFLGLIGKSRRRDRRPTPDEIDAICNWFDDKTRQRVPMSDIIRFAIASAMRAGEITRIRWSDIDEVDRTVVIRDRKDPTRRSATTRRCRCWATHGSLFSGSRRGATSSSPTRRQPSRRCSRAPALRSVSKTYDSTISATRGCPGYLRPATESNRWLS